MQTRESSHHQKELGNFNEIFRKDVAYDSIKSHKKLGFQSFTLSHFWENHRGW